MSIQKKIRVNQSLKRDNMLLWICETSINISLKLIDQGRQAAASVFSVGDNTPFEILQIMLDIRYTVWYYNIRKEVTDEQEKETQKELEKADRTVNSDWHVLNRNSKPDTSS